LEKRILKKRGRDITRPLGKKSEAPQLKASPVEEETSERNDEQKEEVGFYLREGSIKRDASWYSEKKGVRAGPHLCLSEEGGQIREK